MSRRAVVLLLIFLLGVAARVAMMPRDVTPRAGSDEDEYDTYAWNLAEGRGYRGPSPAYPDRQHLTSWRMPAPSLLFAAVYKVVGHRPRAAVLANIVISAATSILIFFLGVRLYGDTVGYLAALAYAVWPHSIPNSTILSSEALYTFLLAAYVLQSIAMGERPSIGRVAASGVLLGASLYARPHPLLLPFVLAWTLIVFWPSPRKIAAGVLSMAIAGSMLMPWVIRNYQVHGAFVPFTTQAGEALLCGSNRVVVTEPKYSGYSVDDARQIPEYAREFDGLDEVDRSRKAMRLYQAWMAENRDKWGLLVSNRFIRFWSPILVQPSWFNRLAMLLSWGPVLVLFPIPFVASLIRYARSRDPRLMVACAILSTLANALIITGIVRYRSPIEGFCLIYAAASIVGLARALAGRPARADDDRARNLACGFPTPAPEPVS